MYNDILARSRLPRCVVGSDAHEDAIEEYKNKCLADRAFYEGIKRRGEAHNDDENDARIAVLNLKLTQLDHIIKKIDSN